MALKLFKPYVSQSAKQMVLEVLNTDYLAEGVEVKQFEYEFGKKFNKKNPVAVNSGTSALELAYDLAGLRKGDEVITPVLTCTATNIPLVRRGVKIVFADIDYDLNINVEDVKRKLTPRTKAIVFVHFGGNNRGLREIIQLGKERKITVIEDAAQAVGSLYWGHADYCAVSLQAIKTLTTGDGGFLLCREERDRAKAKRLRWFGYDREEKQRKGDTDLTEAGYKYHMNNISAAIGRGNLKEIDTVLNHRGKLAEIYRANGMFAHAWLAGKIGEMPVDAPFEVGRHHYRNDKYTLFKSFKTHCPVMDELENKYFFVPYHHGVSEEDAIKICNTINQTSS